MTGVFRKRGHLDTGTQIQRMPCEDEGRDRRDAAEAKECQGLSASHQKLGQRHKQILLLNSADTLILDCLPSEL